MLVAFQQAGSFVALFIVTGGSAAGLALWLFKTFAKGWLQSQFDQDLEVSKAANARELERMRSDIGRLMDRATKFHQREYDVLPEAWGLLNRAYGAAAHVVSVIQQHADLSKMSDVELEEFFEVSNLRESQKGKIRQSSEKNTVYSSIRTWKMIGEADTAIAEYQNYVILNGVFIEDDIAQKMADAAKALRSCLIGRRIAGEGPDPSNLWLKASEDLEKVEPLVLEIKTDVKRRLWDIHLPGASAPAR